MFDFFSLLLYNGCVNEGEYMKEQFAKDLIYTKILTDRLSEGKAENAGLFTVKFQILYLVEKYGKTSPKILIKELVLAKSNLALIASEMIHNGLIEKGKDEHNKKEIYYTITPKGKQVLAEKMKAVENLEMEDVGEACILLEKVNHVLQKIR